MGTTAHSTSAHRNDSSGRRPGREGAQEEEDAKGSMGQW
jgi:hypothetical protein